MTDLLTLALYAELFFDDLPVQDRQEGNDVANAMGHALGAALRLRPWPQSEAAEVTELAAALFSRSGYTAKAFTMLTPVRRQVEALASVSSSADLDERKLRFWVRAIVQDIVQRDFRRAANRGTEASQIAWSRRVSRDHSRLAFVLGALTGQLDRLARERPRPDDIGTVRGRLVLLKRLAQAASDNEVLTLMVRLEGSVGAFLVSSVMQVMARLNTRFVPAYEAELTGRGSHHPVFEFWQPQAQALSEGLLRRGSKVLSLPTSAGKTLLAEVKIAQVLGEVPDGLVVYVAPYTALAVQVVDKLRERLEPAGLAAPLLWTGSYEIDRSVSTLGALVVMTPEKLDAVLRGSLEDDPRSSELVDRLRLVVLDECHMVGNPSRGLTYELLITRLLARFPDVDLCAMSAVLGNPDRMAHWLTGSSQNYTASDWRPTNTRFLVYGRDGMVVDQDETEVATLLPWSVARTTAANVAVTLSRGAEWPVFVLETRRDWAEQLAEEVSDQIAARPWAAFERTAQERERVASLAANELGAASSLVMMLRRGVAFHHGGLSAELRHEIELLVRRRYLRVVASTTTLAEGVDLPFRSVVCPHVYFDRQAMTRSLFQNVAGRAGRAYSSIEGIVIFLEPTQAAGRRYLFEDLLSNARAPIDVRSQLPAIGRAPRTVGDLGLTWRFQSQLLGVLADGSFESEQAAGLARATFAASSSSGAAISIIRQRASALLSGWELVDPPLATAASPYTLTPFGRAACLAGLSAESAVVLRRELILAHGRAEAWLREAEWERSELSDELIDGLLRISLSPLEALSRALDLGRDDETRLERLHSWTSRSSGAFEAMTASDRRLLLRWVRGDDGKSIATEYDERQPARGPLRRRERSARIMDLNEYFANSAALLAWMLSAVIRIGKYLEVEEGLPLPPNLELGVKLVRHGVDTWAAVFLVERLEVHRAPASALARSLIASGVRTEEAILDVLADMADEELESLVGDRGVAVELRNRVPRGGIIPEIEEEL